MLAAVTCGLAPRMLAKSSKDLEPRSYSPSPVGLNFVVASYSYSSGAVIVDASLPLSDVKAYMNGVVLGWGRTFGVVGRQAQVAASLPFAFGDVSGNVFEQRQSVTRSGLADCQGQVLRQPLRQSRPDAAGVRRANASLTLRRHQPDGLGPDRPIPRGQAHQPRDQPMGLPARPRCRGSLEAVRPRGADRRLALHREPGLLSGRRRPPAGCAVDPARPRQLHVPAVVVGRGRRHLVWRWRGLGRRRPQERRGSTTAATVRRCRTR